VRIRIAVPEAFASPPVINAALEAVTRLDEHMIRAGQSPTSRELVAQGAIWRPENMGDEHFDHGGTIAARGWGDCDDWAPLHAATLRASGEDPGAVARVVPSGPNTYHAIVHRSDGSIDDPSVDAGMKAQRVGGVDDTLLSIWACDPHDGRIYAGQLAPTVGPLSIHCGPGIALRSSHVVGQGIVWEGRCDVPIIGSPLVHVHSYLRRGPKHHRQRRSVHGAVPYALSCTGWGNRPIDALNNAIIGAICCGDAAELNTSLDRYKLLAVQSALAGHSPGEVRDQLIAQMQHDLSLKAAQSGTAPLDESTQLLQALAQEGVIPSGVVVGDFFSDIAHVASGVVSAVSHVANSVAHAVSNVPWGDIIHGVQAAVSVVPGLGTAVSDVIATAETAYDAAAAALSGNPLQGAIDAAYNFALGSIPGAAALHPILDPVKRTLEGMAASHEPLDTAILNGVLASVPDAPKFGPISPKSVAASLAHLIVGHLGVKHTGPRPPVAKPPLVAHPAPVHPAFTKTPPIKPRPAKPPPPPKPPAPKPPPPVVLHPKIAPKVPPKPLGVPHAAVHVHHTAMAAPPPRPAPLPGPAPAPAPAHPSNPPPGATQWVCAPLPAGQWACSWH
jgi:hypothetical protein